jgi:hypothetical protein
MLFKATPLIALYTLLVSGIGYAEDTLVQTLSEGACWFEQGENLKIVSFNDHESFSISRESLDETVLGVLDKTKREEMNYMLHCSGHGASLIVKSEESCAWIGFDKGQLSVKSNGANEDLKNNGLCDGYKRGELLIGLHVDDESVMNSLNSYFTSYRKISAKLYLGILKKEFLGKEKTLLNELKRVEKNIRYVELNQFQHPVGEYTNLK